MSKDGPPTGAVLIANEPGDDKTHADDDLVELNVGGTAFTTTKQTLLRAGACPFFVHLLSGRFAVRRDKVGRIFIDRDGTHFHHILNFLRDGSERWLGTARTLPACIRNDLRREAAFYSISELETLLDAQSIMVDDAADRTCVMYLLFAERHLGFLHRACNYLVSTHRFRLKQMFAGHESLYAGRPGCAQPRSVIKHA